MSFAMDYKKTSLGLLKHILALLESIQMPARWCIQYKTIYAEMSSSFEGRK